MSLSSLRLTMSLGLLIAFLTVCSGGGWAQHAVYLQTPNSVPSYCQETDIWCGAATGQMILEGYPGGVEHANTQTAVWNSIQSHKDDAGVGWATDPDGLQGALTELGGDPGVHWAIFANPNAQSETFSFAYWLTRRRFPAAALVYGFQHWVMIDGFTSDVDPTTAGTTTINLQQVEIVDPWNPPCASATHGGVRSLMTGSNWFANYWYTPGNAAASKWNGNYVAVIEPPERQGTATAPKQPERGEVISPSRAQELALRYLREAGVEKRPGFAALRTNKPLQATLVNSSLKGYYIVPVGYQESQISQGAVLVNAYNGEFQEVGVFQQPLKYLPRDRAVKLAVSYLCACSVPRTAVQAQLIFQPSEQTQSRFLPVWEIRVNRSRVYVTQDGRIFDRITPLPLGD